MQDVLQAEIRKRFQTSARSRRKQRYFSLTFPRSLLLFFIFKMQYHPLHKWLSYFPQTITYSFLYVSFCQYSNILRQVTPQVFYLWMIVSKIQVAKCEGCRYELAFKINEMLWRVVCTERDMAVGVRGQNNFEMLMKQFSYNNCKFNWR